MQSLPARSSRNSRVCVCVVAVEESVAATNSSRSQHDTRVSPSLPPSRVL